MADTFGLVALGVGAMLGVIVLVPVARRVALAYDITDRPRPEKLHATPTPYLGGVAIALTALGASAFLQGWSLEVAVIVLGAVALGIVGLVDDMRSLNPGPRL